MRKTSQQLSSNSVKGKVVLSVFGVGAGEGLAAVCGHQSGDEGTWAAMPSSSLGDRSNRIIRFRFPAPTPFLSRVRGTRAPTDAAVAGRPPYRGLGALGKRAQALHGQAVQLLRVSGEVRTPHEHGTANADAHPPLFGIVKMACKISGLEASRRQKGKSECRMSLTARMNGTRRNRTTTGTIPIGGRIGTVRQGIWAALAKWMGAVNVAW